MMVLSYDDGRIEDYTKVYPVHQSKGVPAVFAPIVCDVGGTNSLSAEQLKEFYNNGHEIASHTYTHTSMGTFSGYYYHPTVEIPAGSLEIPINNATWFATVPRLLNTVGLIEEGEKKETFTVVSRETPNHILTIQDPLVNSYSPNAKITHDISTLIAENDFSKRRLASLGIYATGMIYPGGGHSKETRDITSRYYRWGRATWWQDEPNVFDPSQGIDLYALGSEEFCENRGNNLTLAEMESMMDEAVERKCLVLFHSHSFYEELTTERIEWMIDTALSKGIEIVTMSEALNYYGATNYWGHHDSPEVTEPVEVTVAGTPTEFIVPTRDQFYREGKPIIKSKDGSFWEVNIDNEGNISAKKIPT